jgi:hypothetical protein
MPKVFYSSVWSKWTLNRGGWQYDRPEVGEEGVVNPQDDISVAIFIIISPIFLSLRFWQHFVWISDCGVLQSYEGPARPLPTPLTRMVGTKPVGSGGIAGA